MILTKEEQDRKDIVLSTYWKSVINHSGITPPQWTTDFIRECQEKIDSSIPRLDLGMYTSRIETVRGAPRIRPRPALA